MKTKSYQGKSKLKQDAAELLAFIGVVGAGVSILFYFIYLMFLIN